MKPRFELFYSYAHTDEVLRDQLEKHLSLLKREKLIRTWHDRRIVGGLELDPEILSHLETADIILLLVTPDFMASVYCYTKEMERALKRHDLGLARVIPIILRDVDWKTAPFGKLLALPTDGKAVTLWPNRDEAFTNVARGIRKSIMDLIEQRQQELKSLERTVSNPNYTSDLRTLEGKYNLADVLNKETVVLVIGNTVVAELVDRPVAERLRDEIDRRGKPYPYRRGIVLTSDTWKLAANEVQRCPIISIGGPSINSATKELNVPPNSYTVIPGVHGAYRKHNGVAQAALWGDGARNTQTSVEHYMKRSDGLRAFLAIIWPA
ncbi:MAG TPA: toll/interleukin-1 receptor domain-containing protein [Terriglobales bacterium]|nr:toll/interleukin-1 receptor domain-containing protein [Terriglobales bacterium]